MENHDAVVIKGDGITGFDFFEGDTRWPCVRVQLGRANVVHPVGRFAQGQDALPCRI